MNEEQFIQLRDLLTSVACSVEYYGDKGPNMGWKEPYGDPHNVYVAWEKMQWEGCFQLLGGLRSNIDGLPRRFEIAECVEKQLSHAEETLCREIHSLRQDLLDRQNAADETLRVECDRLSRELSVEQTERRNERTEAQRIIGELEQRLRSAQDMVSEREEQVRSEGEYAKRLETALNGVQQDNDTLVNQKSDLEQEIDRMKTRLAEIQQAANERDAAHSAAEQKLREDHRAEIARLQSVHEEELNGKQRSCEAQLERERDELNALHEEQMACKEKEWQQVKKSLEHRITELQSETERLDDQLREAQSLSQKRAAECEASEQRYAESMKPYELYQPILEALQSCALFRPIVEKYHLEGSGIKPLFALVQQIGVGIEFAKELYDVASQARKRSPESITDSERRVYEALNHCYRSLWQKEFDIYRQPGNQAITETFQKVKYDSAESVNIANSRDRDSKYAQEVYVPSLWAKTEHVYAKALVKAGNL